MVILGAVALSITQLTNYIKALTTRKNLHPSLPLSTFICHIA
jgi:hypothetical protein